MLVVSQDFLKLQGRGLQIGSVIFETIIFRIFATLVLCIMNIEQLFHVLSFQDGED